MTSVDHRQVFPALTGVRALAAYMVYLSHFNPFHELFWGRVPFRITQEFHSGVFVFYVLSGFLIHYRYGSPRLGERVASWREYVIRRVGRIFPVYWLLLALTYLVVGIPSWWGLFVHVTLLQGYFPDQYQTGIVQAWTLTVEETFYFCAPLLFLTIRTVPLWLVTALSLFIGFVIFASTGSDLLLRNGILGAIPSFAVGMELSRRLARKDPNQPKRLGWYIPVGLILFCFAHYGLAACRPADRPMDGAHGIVFALVLTAFLPVSVGLIFWGLLTQKSLLGWLLKQPLMVALGQASYAFYLLHLGVVEAFLRHFLGVPSIWKFVLLNIIALLLYRFFERPITDFVKTMARSGSSSERTPSRPVLLAPAVALGAALAVVLLLWNGPWGPSVRGWAQSRQGDVLVLTDRFDQAKRRYFESLDAWGDQPDALVNLARLEQRDSEHVAALKHLEQALRLDPQSAEGNLYRGQSLEILNDLEAAAESYERTLTLGRNTRVVMRQLGSIYERQRRFEDAEQVYRKAFDAYFDCEAPAVDYAEFLIRRRRYREARSVLEVAKSQWIEKSAINTMLDQLPDQ